MAIPSPKSTKSNPTLPDHSLSYSLFYRYAAFILFAKEVDTPSYDEIQELYLTPAGKSYKDEFRTFANHWKSSCRKATSEDLEFIFSSIKEQQPQSTVAAVRSATIKRSGTVAKTLRAPIDGLSRSSDRDKERADQEGKAPVANAFSDIVGTIVTRVVKEQSFIMEFLSLRSTEGSGRSFEEFVALGDNDNWKSMLGEKRPPELDKSLSSAISRAMGALFSWLPDELSTVIEWCRAMDPL
jgi:exocyst complex component 1